MTCPLVVSTATRPLHLSTVFCFQDPYEVLSLLTSAAREQFERIRIPCLLPTTYSTGVMADDAGDAEDERAIELSSIAAIFPELVIEPTNSFSASIDVSVEPVEPLAVLFPSIATEGQPAVHPSFDVSCLSHLPPLTLQLSLPDGYPTEKPPVFELHTQFSWLPESKLQELRDASHNIWEEMGRDQVVFSYIDFLREAAERGFDLIEGEGGFLQASQDLKVPLLDFDLKATRAKFEQETFECGVCLEPKKGALCHRLTLCSHVFCVECLQDYFNNCIIEGDVVNVKCMAPKCGEDENLQAVQATQTQQQKKRRRARDRTLDPSELLQIPISQDQVQRYVKLKRKKLLESDRTTVYCPRQWCQGPARSKETQENHDPDSDSEAQEPRSYDPNTNGSKLPPPAERLAICEDCSFAFCKVCKASWHGEFFSCFPRKQSELTAEEKASEDYMRLHTTPCPTCDARAQKTMGCNHMICFKCNSHFCYLCSAWLDAGNPYEHFNNPKKPCYMRLWELEGGDGGEVGHGFAGGEGLLDFDEDSSDDGIVDDTDDDGEEAPPPAPPPPPARVPNHPRRAARAQQALANRNNNNHLNNNNRNANANANPPAIADQAPPPPRRDVGIQVNEPLLAAPHANPRVAAGLRRPRDPLQNIAERGPPVQGLQRFLEMVRLDEEDEWDSDEMDESDGEGGGDRWEIPVRG